MMVDDVKDFSAKEFLWDEPNETTYRAIEEAERGENLYGPFERIEDLMVALVETD